MRLPFSRLSAALIAWVLANTGLVNSISPRTIQRWLAAEKIKPWNVRSWITPKDLTVFLERARLVLRLYERVPKFQLGEVAFSVDEKTSIQARQRYTHQAPKCQKPAKVEHSYIRKGAVQLFAALNVANGAVFAQTSQEKTFKVFSDFITTIIGNSVAQGNHTIHFLLDNGSAHRPKSLETWLKEWLLQQPFRDSVTINLHWLPVRSSWLNQVEIFFGRLQAFVLTPCDFASLDDLTMHIHQFVDFWNLKARPIRWTYTTADLDHQFSRSVGETPDPRYFRMSKRAKSAAVRPIYSSSAAA